VGGMNFDEGATIQVNPTGPHMEFRIPYLESENLGQMLGVTEK
jgi:hypothetical protein